MLIFALLIKIEDRGTILFKQKRIGKNKKEFYIYKFRSMKMAKEGTFERATTSNDRITKIGAIMRKTKIDELPQLFNVIKGDMILVGPRPDVVTSKVKYTEEQEKVLYSIRPGVTGLASVVYKRENEILDRVENSDKFYEEVVAQEKGKINVQYIHNRNLLLNLKIILATIGIIKKIKVNNKEYKTIVINDVDSNYLNDYAIKNGFKLKYEVEYEPR